MSTTSTYIVDGMTCEQCGRSITVEIERLEGVTEVDGDLASGRVRVTSDRQIEEAAVMAAVDDAGYTVAS